MLLLKIQWEKLCILAVPLYFMFVIFYMIYLIYIIFSQSIRLKRLVLSSKCCRRQCIASSKDSMRKTLYSSRSRVAPIVKLATAIKTLLWEFTGVAKFFLSSKLSAGRVTWIQQLSFSQTQLNLTKKSWFCFLSNFKVLTI